jgi:hypothetical protein
MLSVPTSTTHASAHICPYNATARAGSRTADTRPMLLGALLRHSAGLTPADLSHSAACRNPCKRVWTGDH